MFQFFSELNNDPPPLPTRSRQTTWTKTSGRTPGILDTPSFHTCMFSPLFCTWVTFNFPPTTDFQKGTTHLEIIFKPPNENIDPSAVKERSSEVAVRVPWLWRWVKVTQSHTSQLLLQAAGGSDVFANRTPNFLLKITNSALLDGVEADLWTCWRRCTRFSTWTSIYPAAKPTTP